jgi:hypothetical protein
VGHVARTGKMSEICSENIKGEVRLGGVHMGRMYEGYLEDNFRLF